MARGNGLGAPLFEIDRAQAVPGPLSLNMWGPPGRVGGNSKIPGVLSTAARADGRSLAAHVPVPERLLRTLGPETWSQGPRRLGVGPGHKSLGQLKVSGSNNTAPARFPYGKSSQGPDPGHAKMGSQPGTILIKGNVIKRSR